MVNDSEAERLRTPNKIAGPNAGGPRQLPIRTPRAARVGRFRLLCSPWNKKMSLYATLWKLKFPRHGDYHAGCDWITVTAQGFPAHNRLVAEIYTP